MAAIILCLAARIRDILLLQLPANIRNRP